MTTRAATHHARVEGDDILYQGRRVSPRALTLAIAGEGRNAWRDLWLKFPGERVWKQATRCRSDQERSIRAQSASQAAMQAATPADTVAAAAAVMSDALKTMLELIERVSARPVQADERRVNRTRREEDILADHCAFD